MGRLDQEDEIGIGWKREVRDRLCESITNTKSHLRGHREIYSCRFLIYRHIRKKSEWNHQMTRQTMPQLDIFRH